MVFVITLNKGVHMLNEKERSDLTRITLLIAKGIGKSLDSFREDVLKKEHP